MAMLLLAELHREALVHAVVVMSSTPDHTGAVTTTGGCSPIRATS